MSEVVVQSQSGAIVLPPPTMPRLVMSDALSLAVYLAENPPVWNGAREYPVIAPEVREEAASWLAAIEPWTAPIGTKTLALWLAPVMGSVRNLPKGNDLEIWKRAVAMAVAGLPRGAFTAEAQQDVLQKNAWLPSGAGVYDVVKDRAASIKRQMRALERVIQAPMPPGAPVDRAFKMAKGER